MMTEELTVCPKCNYEKALTHWSSDNLVNWIACPRCRTFTNNALEFPEDKDLSSHDEDGDFWKQVEKDTGFIKDE